MTHNIIHILLHFTIPGLASRFFYKDRFWQAWGIMAAAILVDIDHLFASPIFDPGRCSIGFHPLHSIPAIGLYALMTFIPESKIFRIMGIGLLIHMLIDGADCMLM